MSTTQKSTLSQNNYSDTSIVNNEGPKGVRERPATLLGSSDITGCIQAVFEIIANSLDEFRQGYGSKITIIVDEDNTVTVKDEGRGVPMGWNEKAKRYNYELVFCTLYASGKGKGGAYSSSEGLNGIGCTAAQYTSDFMVVEVVRVNDQGRKIKYTMNFKDGYADGKLQEVDVTEQEDIKTGTSIKFRPSNKVFMGTNIRYETYLDRLRKKAMVVPGVRIELRYKDTQPVELYFERGMAEYVDNNTENSRWNKEVMFFEKEYPCNDEYLITGNYKEEKTYKGESRVALAFAKEQGFIEVYHNGAILSAGGPTRDVIVEACVKVFNQDAKDNGKIQKTENISKKDVEDLIVACAETRCPGEFSMFEHQTKVAIRNESLINLVYKNVYDGLVKWSMTNRKEFDKVLTEILINKNARDKAESVKKSQLKKLSTDINKLGNAPDKLLPAKCKDPSKCSIYIIEGDSAKGAVSSARNGDYDAVFPLRGKIPNCLKKNFESLLKSDIIINLLTILGCGVETQSKYIKDIPEFNLSKLNYHKIILTTDADVDGGHITCLLLIFFMRFVPTLVKKGFVYLAVSPLFFVTVDGQDKKLYGYSEEDRDRIIMDLLSDGVPRNKIHVQRSKGLGENSEDDMYETVLNPETRRLIQVQYPEDDTELWELCNQLLGNDIDSRREIVKEYFNQVEIVEK